jgi:Tol biopolymer transport system component
MTATLPQLNFLTNSSSDTDYRPAVNSTGNVVVFERTPVGGGGALTTLYKITDFKTPNPEPFLSGPNAPAEQTRADWCWKTDQVAFNGASSKDAAPTVWQVGNDGVIQEVPNTEYYSYPTWGLDGSLLVTENSRHPLPPRNTIFDPATGKPKEHNIDGVDSAGTALFGGMPTVGPNDLPQIAYAGQPQIQGWAGSTSPGPKYDQKFNYIFLNSFANGAYTSAPMETDASLTTYDPSYQGRAPAWAPNRQTIAFESNRNGGYAIYLCDLASGTITQVTDPSLGGQHAKFFPCGTKLILCINHPQRNPKTMGVAWVDISGLLLA